MVGGSIHFRRVLGLFLLCQILILANPITVVEVAAPPIGGSCFPGIITGTNQDLIISDAEVNITANLLPSPYGYQSDISVDGVLNLTNPYDAETSILLLYNPAWGSWSINVSDSSLDWRIEGEYVSMHNTTFSNLTHPRQLPAEFHDRFPSWVWVHEELWYDANNLTLVNITLGPQCSRLFHFEDSYIVHTYDIDYFTAGFGFSAGQIQADRTIIRMRIELQHSTNFQGVSFYPDDSVSISQVGEDYIGEWLLEYPYSPELLYGNSPEPIRGGCSGYITINQYYPPILDDTSSTQSSTPESMVSDDSVPIQTLGLGLISASFIGAIVVLILYTKRK